MDGPGDLTRGAILEGVINGRSGKGSIYVMASGNGGFFQDICTVDGYANSIYTISVGVNLLLYYTYFRLWMKS